MGVEGRIQAQEKQEAARLTQKAKSEAKSEAKASAKADKKEAEKEQEEMEIWEEEAT
jgi:hypothetical protein